MGGEVDHVIDSAEKPYECFDETQHERKISDDFTRSSVRPETRRMNGRLFSRTIFFTLLIVDG